MKWSKAQLLGFNQEVKDQADMTWNMTSAWSWQMADTLYQHHIWDCWLPAVHASFLFCPCLPAHLLPTFAEDQPTVSSQCVLTYCVSTLMLTDATMMSKAAVCTQTTPGFDAKGIETVRRDTCPAVAKTMERSLRLLFATRDLSEVGIMSSTASKAEEAHAHFSGHHWCNIYTAISTVGLLLCHICCTSFTSLFAVSHHKCMLQTSDIAKRCYRGFTQVDSGCWRPSPLGYDGGSQQSNPSESVGEGVLGEAVGQDSGQQSLGAGLCFCQRGAAGDVLPQGCSGAPCSHCGC